MPLNHVALTVADRELSAAFYGEHFGLVSSRGTGGGIEDGCEPGEGGGMVSLSLDRLDSHGSWIR